MPWPSRRSFTRVNARSALQLGHARGVALLAASQAGPPDRGIPPAEVKRAVVGYGRAEKLQVQHMVRLLLGLAVVPGPFDVSDALAVAICHLHGAACRTASPAAAGSGATRAAELAQIQIRMRDPARSRASGRRS